MVLFKNNTQGRKTIIIHVQFYFRTKDNFFNSSTMICYFLTCARHQTISEEKVLHSGGPIQRSRVGIVNCEGQRVGDVIVKIFTHTRQIVYNRNTNGIQFFSRTYTAIQKYLRRIYGA